MKKIILNTNIYIGSDKLATIREVDNAINNGIKEDINELKETIDTTGDGTKFLANDGTYREVNASGSGTIIQGPKGDKGDQGIPGESSYLHIKYSENAIGYPMTDTPSTYIGIYVDSESDDSTDYTKYKWSRIRGLQGPQGDQGPSGAKGLQGDKGEKGDKGDRGPQGLQGPRGEQGPTGPQGPKGDKGDKGADGIMTFTDLTDEQKESLRGPQGIQGIQGDRGPQGLQGPKGDKGDNGVAGKSAYQIAVDNGYVGTESAWVASLKGDKGDTGAQGIQGIQGKQGPQGPKGDKGDQGNDGFTPIITFNNEKTEMTVSGKTTTNKVDFKKITEDVVSQTINNSLVTVNVLTQEEYDALGSYENAFYFIKG